MNDGGLPKLATSLRALLPELEIRPGQVVGRLGSAGSQVPKPSSAARLRFDGAEWWVPWPMAEWMPTSTNEPISSPLFLWGGQTLRFPTMRVLIKRRWGISPYFEYFSLDEWLRSAIRDWVLPLSLAESADTVVQDYEKHGGLPTVARQLNQRNDLPAHDKLRVVGNIIRYALNGRDRLRHQDYRRMGIGKAVGLVLPERVPFLRYLCEGVRSRTGDSITDSIRRGAHAFQARCHRSFLLSAAAYWPELDAYKGSRLKSLAKKLQCGIGVPSCRRIKQLYFAPCGGQEPWGIDPYHTTEDERIRLQLHIALGARIAENRRSFEPTLNNPHSLSPATSQIPFASFDDPRRLLMGAKAQVHAVPVAATEPPLVSTALRAAPDADPPGANLRVGYMAWAGWNHEDAWVLSQSAADKLESRTVITREIPISVLESDPDVASAGEHIERPYYLVQHLRLSPAFLWPKFGQLRGMLKRMSKGQFAELLMTGICSLRRSPEDKLKIKGTDQVKVVHVETRDLLANAAPAMNSTGTDESCESVEVSPKVQQDYREVVRIDVEIVRPLQPGDKLATRHGHKGVIGLILPDEQMPIWNGQPLEALIDPISVINRGNWGQLFETLAGAVVSATGLAASAIDSAYEPADWLRVFRQAFPDARADDQGRSIVAAPVESGWFSESGAAREFPAVAGCQFVMRMPQNASEKLSVGRVTVDFQTQSALWAHEEPEETTTTSKSPSESGPKFSTPAENLRRLLWLAGIDLRIEENGGKLKVRRLHLDDASDIPTGTTLLKLGPPRRNASIKSQLGKVTNDTLHYITLPNPLTMSGPPSSSSPGKSRVSSRFPWQKIRWFPILSPDTIDTLTGAKHGDSDQPARFPSALARSLEELCRAVVTKGSKGPKAAERRRRAVCRVVREALRAAIGLNHKDSKRSFMRKKVQGHRVAESVRAVLAPIGLSSEGPAGEFGPPSLNEIRLPTKSRGELFKGAVDQSPVWLKRDPVLDRWSAFAVRADMHSDQATIRLPASLLNAIQGDCDGDDVAVFRNPMTRDVAQSSKPTQILVNDFFQEPQYVPGKQYVYGLYLLSKDDRNARLLSQIQGMLADSHAPIWPPQGAATGVKEQLDCWNRSASKKAEHDEIWWGMLEVYALRALARDPGMGLGIFDRPADIRNLAVVVCGAAKAELYPEQNPQDEQWNLMSAILNGTSLDLLRNYDGNEPIDPIRTVMAAAVSEKGTFGNEFRHLFFKARKVTPRTIRAAQALTRQMTQSVLSVKSVGKSVPEFEEYEEKLRHRWITPKNESSTGSASAKREAFSELFKNAQKNGLVAEIDKAFSVKLVSSGDRTDKKLRHYNPRPWQKWFFAPHDLPSLLHPTAKNGIQFVEIDVPLDELRVRPWIASG